jgi:hypothetical protein
MSEHKSEWLEEQQRTLTAMSWLLPAELSRTMRWNSRLDKRKSAGFELKASDAGELTDSKGKMYE